MYKLVERCMATVFEVYDEFKPKVKCIGVYSEYKPRGRSTATEFEVYNMCKLMER